MTEEVVPPTLIIPKEHASEIVKVIQRALPPEERKGTIDLVGCFEAGDHSWRIWARRSKTARHAGKDDGWESGPLDVKRILSKFWGDLRQPKRS